jgi:hypothetical protein
VGKAKMKKKREKTVTDSNTFHGKKTDVGLIEQVG